MKDRHIVFVERLLEKKKSYHLDVIGFEKIKKKHFAKLSQCG